MRAVAAQHQRENRRIQVGKVDVQGRRMIGGRRAARRHPGPLVVSPPAGDRLMANEATMPANAAADELAEGDWWADLGEILGPVTHEFNNFLNTLLLQVAVLDLSAPQEDKSELAIIRRQGREVAAVVKQLQQLRRRRHGEPQPADLNQAVSQA